MNRREFVAKSARCAGSAAAFLAPPLLVVDGVPQAPQSPYPMRPPAKEPLRVLTSNPRYFTDGFGRRDPDLSYVHRRTGGALSEAAGVKLRPTKRIQKLA
jgi:hypothetical protein